MLRQACLLTLLVATAACSQRSPWQVVNAPVSSPAQQAGAEPPADLASPRAAPADATAVAHLSTLYFPVAGIDSSRLDDSFNAPRDGGARRHRAIDIMAPRGTPVLSAGDGRILRLSKNGKGGITVYATDVDERFVYYYAHLEGYHPGIYEGKPLMRGDTLGFVGTTGNAPEHIPHLHFQVMHMPPDGKYWDGEPINPYPLLRQSGGRSSGG